MRQGKNSHGYFSEKGRIVTFFEFNLDTLAFVEEFYNLLNQGHSLEGTVSQKGSRLRITCSIKGEYIGLIGEFLHNKLHLSRLTQAPTIPEETVYNNEFLQDLKQNLESLKILITPPTVTLNLSALTSDEVSSTQKEARLSILAKPMFMPLMQKEVVACICNLSVELALDKVNEIAKKLNDFFSDYTLLFYVPYNRSSEKDINHIAIFLCFTGDSKKTDSDYRKLIRFFMRSEYIKDIHVSYYETITDAQFDLDLLLKSLRTYKKDAGLVFKNLIEAFLKAL